MIDLGKRSKHIIKSALQPIQTRLFQTDKLSVGRRLSHASFWSFVGTAFSRGLNLLAMIFVARMLKRAAFGELGIIQTTVAMFGILAGFGMGITATKHVSEYRETEPEKAGRILALVLIMTFLIGVIIAIVFFILSPWLATRTLAAPHLAPMLRLSSFLLFLSAVNGAQISALAGYEAFKTIAKVNWLAGLFSFPFILILTYYFQLRGAVWGLIGGMILNLLLSHRALLQESRKKRVKILLRSCWREGHIISSFSIPAVLSSVFALPVYWICNAILVNHPRGYDEMGLMNSASQWYSLVLFLPGIFGQSALPILAERVGQGDKKNAKSILILNSKISLLTVFPIAVLGSLLSRPIMNFYGPGFSAGWPVLVVTLLTGCLVAFQNPVGNLIAASSRMWLGAAMNLGWGVAFIILTLLLVPLGALGLATARAGAYALHSLWTFGFAIYYFRSGRQ
jgi:O-antigen/teichoic acid export membrane protein